jgi:hypothetical protein
MAMSRRIPTTATIVVYMETLPTCSQRCSGAEASSVDRQETRETAPGR